MSTPALQRRTITTLAGSQVLGGVGVSAGAAVGALLSADVSGSEAWAGLGGTAQTLGGALAAILVARIMAAKGRRPGLVAGSTLLTAAIPLRQRPAAQGLSDVAMGLAGGGGGALAGVVVGWWGYPALALLAGGTALVVGLLVPLGRRRDC